MKLFFYNQEVPEARTVAEKMKTAMDKSTEDSFIPLTRYEFRVLKDIHIIELSDPGSFVMVNEAEESEDEPKKAGRPKKQ